MSNFLTPEFWSQRYRDKQIGWDLGQISPPIKEYVDQLTNKELKILIPGCGLGHEGEYLFKAGFHDVHLLDFSIDPLVHFKDKILLFPKHTYMPEIFLSIKTNMI